ncbi:MAG TPA: STAS domain-containing protein [Candidatus Cybelea sp.]
MINDGGVQNADMVLVVFRGEYDLASKERLRQEFAALVDEASVVLDFSDVSYFDSTMIEELVWLRNAREAAKLERATLVLNNPSLLRILEMLDLGKFLQVVPSLDDVIGRDGKSVRVRYAHMDD